MNRISVTFDDEMFSKLRYISDYEMRTPSAQLRMAFRDYILKFEKKHGEITQ